ncbi:MAG: pyridoxal phosphate-dependent aminotransferase [Gammaproteobacteria bacterium]
MKVSHRAQSIKPSPTLAVSAKAAELKAAGKNIISLAAGEPDFDTPDFVKTAAIKSIEDGYTKYTAVDGTPSLKKAIQNKFKQENDLDYNLDQILVSVGCKHSIYNLMQAVLDPGDEVIIPAPYWVSYPDMVQLTGAQPVILKTGIRDDFKITPKQLKSAINENTRMLIMNSPSNPTGSYYTDEELRALGEVLIDHPEILIASDDIYEHILWGANKFSNIVNACPKLYDQTVVLNGVSKAYSMTGWRIGYAAGPLDVIKAMKKIQSQSTSNPSSAAQFAAEAALTGDQDIVREWCNVFKTRHDFVCQEMNKIDGVQCRPSEGTFYSFPDLSEVIERLPSVSNDLELAEFLLEEAEVAIVPGSAFGASGCIRISFATSMELLEESLSRISKALA